MTPSADVAPHRDRHPRPSTFAVTEKDEFFSFDEALDRLRLKEEELKRLVSEGEIRAFRDGETMKLRRGDVDTLRRELMGGDVVDLDDASDEDLVLSDPGMVTEELSAADTILEDETLLTEELDVAGIDAELDDSEFDELEDLDDLEEAEDDEPKKRRRPEPEPEPMNPLALAGVFLTTILLILAFPVLKNVNGGISDIADSIASSFAGGSESDDPTEAGASEAGSEESGADESGASGEEEAANPFGDDDAADEQ